MQLVFFEPRRLKAIQILAFPIIGGMISQNLLNLIDTAMVGHLGDAALAAVGIASFTTFVSNSFALSLTVGVQALAARLVGSGDTRESAQPLNHGILLALVAAAILSPVLYLAAPIVFSALSPDSEVVNLGSDYWRWRIIGMVFVGINTAFRGFWNGTDRSALYFRTNILMHAANVFLNYCLIFGNCGFPGLGVTGAAIGSTAATGIGSCLYLYLGFKHARSNGFLSPISDWAMMRSLLRVSFPAAVQNTFFASGFTVMYWIIGQIGTSELAGANVLINVMLVAILPGVGLGQAAATFVGQALGRQDKDDAKRWGWDVAQIAVVFLAMIGIPMLAFPHGIGSIFIHSTDTLDLIIPAMRLSGAIIGIEGLGLVLLNAIQGAGDSKSALKISMFMQWGIFLPVAYIIGPVLGGSLLQIWSIYALYRLVLAGVLAAYWESRRWDRVEL